MRMPMSFIFKKNILPMLRVQKSKRAGFTLLELIGVMVVISILLAVALPSTIDLIQVQRSVNERAELPKIAEALKRGMLREQLFPIYENDASKATDGSEASEVYWWNLAARHGGGSANELRYPLGVRPGSDNTRKLYFAEPNWGNDTFDSINGNGTPFSYITGDGPAKTSKTTTDGWVYPEDPTELRLLLISTTNPDLSLPDKLDSDNQFNAFWNHWAVGIDGDPAIGKWSDYGLSSDEWDGHAVELNVQRIDLRDWLCTVAIENRRAILEASGDEFDNASVQKSGAKLDDPWVSGSVYAYTTNQVGSEVILQLEEVLNNSNSYTVIKNVVLTKRGRIPKEDLGDPKNTVITIEVRGNKPNGAATATITLNYTDLAPIFLIGPNNVNYDLFDFENDPAGSVIRYFLLNQELLLREPWNQTNIGIFSITEPFSTLRFDGLQWHY